MGYRETAQPLLPRTKPEVPAGQPDIYPSHKIMSGAIETGYMALAGRIAGHPLVLIDGYIGIFWEEIRQSLQAAGIRANWIATSELLKPADAIDEMLAPYLGGDDPLFGKRYPGSLEDFFRPASGVMEQGSAENPSIIYGLGAFLFGEGYRVYIDLPKNETQYRSRAGVLRNLGAEFLEDPKQQYKRMFFVDWIALNRHKADYVAQIDLFVDGQDAALPRLLAGDDVRATFDQMLRTVFRVRPWFEPGVWGGQWLRANIPGLAQQVPNYAWSFEMIAPEQGIILENDSALLELSYDWLQYHDNEAVLGAYAKYFGHEFPIRFDFLDTIHGGNLSLQCHPRQSFIREHFGEHFTQDETYYIFAAGDDACVYLGFQAGIDPAAFRQALEDSQGGSYKLEVERYVQRHPAAVGDLFLIPHGTVHSAGAGNVVLEISATPYIFTFKLYDWLRLGLDGNPRPLNLERAFANLDFSAQGDAVGQLLSKPILLHEDGNCRVEQLPTHAKHFYDIQRLTLGGSMECETEDSVQVMMVTAGDGVLLDTVGLEAPRTYHFAETFIVPAACGNFRLSALGGAPVTVIRAYLRREWFSRTENQWLRSHG